MLLSAAVLAMAACRAEPPPTDDAEPAPRPDLGVAHDFTLPTLDDGTFTLSDHRGQVVILNFWATWCAPCIIEVPELVALQDELGDQNVLVVGVSQDTGAGARGEVRDFAARLEVNYPLVLDTDLSVGQTYGVHSLPTTLIVDREGGIRERRVGLVHREDVLQMLGGLIEMPPAPHEAEPVTAAPPGHEPEEDPLDPAIDPPVVAAVSAKEAGALFEAGFMLVDLREPEERLATGEIPFALMVTLEEFDRSSLPANFGAPIVFIATDDDTAWRAASLAADWGYVNAHPVIGGFEAWRAAGLPIERRPSFSQGM